MRIIEQGPTRKNVFKEVARLRSKDAEVLLVGGRFLGAVYLLGYAIECYLKFAACERNGWNKLPVRVWMTGNREETELYTHQWWKLVEVAGIRRSIEREKKIDAIYSVLCEEWGADAPIPDQAAFR